MPESFAHICSRADASSEYELKEIGALNTELKPRAHGEKIAIPITKGEMKLEFDEVQESSTFLTFETCKNPPKKWEKLGKMVCSRMEQTRIIGQWKKLQAL